MPSGNSLDVSILVTGEDITKEVKINGIRIVKHGSIPGYEDIPSVANSGTHQMFEKLVRGPTNGEGDLMNLVHNEIVVNVRVEMRSRQQQKSKGSPRHETLFPVTHASIVRGYAMKSINTSAREFKFCIKVPNIPHSFMKVRVFCKHSPKHDNSSHENNSTGLYLFFMRGKHDVIGSEASLGRDNIGNCCFKHAHVCLASISGLTSV